MPVVHGPSSAARIVRVDARAPEGGPIREAAGILRQGGLVAFPTETVYGLGADARNARAVERVFTAKGRPADDPLIVHVLDIEGAEAVAAELPAAARVLAEAFWPGPLTLVVPRAPSLPEAVTAGLGTVAVRAPRHAVARALIAAFGAAVAAPSANPFGRTSPTTALHVAADLGDAVDLILDGGPCSVGIESTVVDCTCTPPAVLRPGGVSLEALREVLPAVAVRCAGAADAADGRGDSAGVGATCAGDGADSVAMIDLEGAPAEAEARRSPGTYSRHYAPRARLVLVQGGGNALAAALVEAAERVAAAGKRVGLLLADDDGRLCADVRRVVCVSVGPLNDPDRVARRLFAALRELDAMDVDIVLARDFGSRGVALAIRDRLSRAAEGRVVVLEPPPPPDLAAAAILAAADAEPRA